MNVSVLAVTILGTFGRTAVRPSALTYNPAVNFTLNQDSREARAYHHYRIGDLSGERLLLPQRRVSRTPKRPKQAVRR